MKIAICKQIILCSMFLLLGCSYNADAAKAEEKDTAFKPLKYEAKIINNEDITIIDFIGLNRPISLINVPNRMGGFLEIDKEQYKYLDVCTFYNPGMSLSDFYFFQKNERLIMVFIPISPALQGTTAYKVIEFKKNGEVLNHGTHYFFASCENYNNCKKFKIFLEGRKDGKFDLFYTNKKIKVKPDDFLSPEKDSDDDLKITEEEKEQVRLLRKRFQQKK